MTFIQEVAGELETLLNDWHSLPETWDADLDSDIHSWYSAPPKVFPRKPYFSPSASGSDARELFFKGRGYAREQEGQHPMQKRWTQIGTAVGDMIQRDLLFIEKHGEAKLGYAPQFKFVRTAQGLPLFEDFAKKNHKVEHNGVDFHLFGAPDGIMVYTDDDGNKIRVGLEIKSKQTTAARTSLYSLKEAEAKHEEQAIAYSIMFDCQFYIVLYVNTAHKSWQPTPEEFAATPDIRAFGIECTAERKNALLDRLAWIQDCINRGVMPPTDLASYTFNGFKNATALSLNDEELAAMEAENERLKKSNAPAFVKKNFREALADIKRRRKECTDEELRRKIDGEGRL